MIQVIADAVLKDWEGVDGPDGPIPFSRESVVKILTDLPDFYEDVLSLSKEAETFRDEEHDEAAKNSKESSPGISGGEGSQTNSSETTNDE